MKVVIVNCFDTYENRVDLIHEFFKAQGDDVTIIQSDFRHFKKSYREEPKEGFIFVKSRAYYKNLSVGRLYSHYKYANDAFNVVDGIKPDLLYTFVPPNALARSAGKYKRENKEVKLILDLMDLWPETMPIGRGKNIPPFTYWGAMRDKSLKYADVVITECNLYQDVLKKALKDVRTETVYLAKKSIDVTSKQQLSQEEIHLAYLGSINNIIDIPKIGEIIKEIRKVKPVTLRVIGDGERKQELISTAEQSGAKVEFYGKVYEPQKKQDIFDKCHFGLNIMKESVCVGLTMKSIDYFQHGLPIINNIPADTAHIVEKYGVGINIIDKKENIKGFIEDKLNIDVTSDMKGKALELFEQEFSTKSLIKRYEYVYERLMIS